jgi:hypothetical protein
MAVNIHANAPSARPERSLQIFTIIKRLSSTGFSGFPRAYGPKQQLNPLSHI